LRWQLTLSHLAAIACTLVSMIAAVVLIAGHVISNQPDTGPREPAQDARNVAGVILMQLLPFADHKCLEAFAGFEKGVYVGLDAGSGQKAA